MEYWGRAWEGDAMRPRQQDRVLTDAMLEMEQAKDAR